MPFWGKCVVDTFTKTPKAVFRTLPFDRQGPWAECSSNKLDILSYQKNAPDLGYRLEFEVTGAAEISAATEIGGYMYLSRDCA